MIPPEFSLGILTDNPLGISSKKICTELFLVFYWFTKNYIQRLLNKFHRYSYIFQTLQIFSPEFFISFHENFTQKILLEFHKILHNKLLHRKLKKNNSLYHLHQDLQQGFRLKFHQMVLKGLIQKTLPEKSPMVDPEI